MLSPLSQLHPPITVSLVAMYGDGTIWFSFEGRCNRYATLCIDGRPDSPTRYRLFDGGRHPKQDNVTLVDLRSFEERIAIPLISHSIDSGEMERCFTEYGVEQFMQTFNRYGEPQMNAAHDFA